MILTKPSFKILNLDSIKGILPHLEKAGKLCYKSEKNITDTSSALFIKGIITKGHESVIEHSSLSVRIICDRGVSHELVRHRIASYSQESTRYCDYNKGQLEFIIPPWVDIAEGEYNKDSSENRPGSLDSDWYYAMLYLEGLYRWLRKKGWTPQKARNILPISLKTELVMTMNLRSWRNFFKLRALGTTGKPHPQMLELSIPMLKAFKENIPVVFDDLVI